MMTKVDLNREGLDAGSRTDDDDWNDWKEFVMSLDKAKLFRNSTFKNIQINKDRSSQHITTNTY